MHLDPTAYLRIEAHQSIDTSAFGASFATSTGDILEVSSFGEGVFRLRMGPRTLPDYGIVQHLEGLLRVSVVSFEQCFEAAHPRSRAFRVEGQRDRLKWC